MSKKKGKSQNDNINWDEGLINEKLADDKWRPFIAFIAPSEPSCDSIITSLTNAVEEGTRRRFCIINKDAMLSSAKDDARLAAGASAGGGGGGGKKSKMGKSAPAAAPKPLHPEVCEHVISIMNSGEPMPHSLVARMLKYKLLRKRTSDLAAKEALIKEAEEALKAAKAGSGKTKANTGRASKKGKDTPSGKGGKGGDSGAGSEFPMPQKPPTTMKKRGEEDTDSKYIDDEPVDGPDAYLLLTGFDEAQVLQHMEGIGVMVDAVVKAKPSSTVVEGGKSKDNDDTTELSEEEQQLLDKRENDLKHYWYHVQQIVSSSQDGSAIRNMATIEYLCPPPLTASDSNQDITEDEKKEFNQSVFTSLAQLLYNLLISYDQYQNYLKYLDIKSVPLGVSTVSPFPSAASKEDLMKTPEAQPETPISKRLLPVDMRLYNKLIDNVPTDAISTEIILHCMVEQVTSTLSEPSETVSQGDTLHAQLNDSLNDIISVLPLPPSTNNGIQQKIQEAGNNTSIGSCINWNDNRSLMSSNNPAASTCMIEANKTAADKSLHTDTISFPKLTTSAITQYEKQLHVLKYFCSNVPGLQVESVLTGLLVTLSLEHIHPPSASKIPNNGFVSVDESLLFDYPLALPLAVHESTALVPASVNGGQETENGIIPSPPLSIDLPDPLISLSNYTVLEPLSHDIIYQMIGNAHHSHPYMYLYHHKLTGSLILAMYSGYVSDESTVTEWNRHLHTRVGFNNYLKHIQSRVGEEVDKAIEVDDEQREEIEERRGEILEAKKKEIEEKQAAIAKQEADSKQSSAKGGKKSQTDSKKSSAGKKSALASSGVPTPAAASDDLELVTSLPQFNERTLYSGYDIGDTVLLSMGEVNKAFTSDGVCIVKEKRQIIDGPITGKVKIVDSYISLSAVFIQSTSPQPPPTLNEPSKESPDANPSEPNSPDLKETEVPNPIPKPPESVLFNAVEGTLSNGISLSLSHYGPLGDGSLPVQPKSAKLLEKLEMQNRPESSNKDSRPSSQQTSGKVSKRQQEEQQKLQEQQKALEEKLAKEKEDMISKLKKEREKIFCRNKYQQLNMSTKHGLQITCSMNADSVDDNQTNAGIIIEQNYTGGNHLPIQLSEEKSRAFLPDGSVLKYMKDRSVVVLCRDGTVLQSQLPGSPYDGLFPPTDNDVDQQPPSTNSQTKVSFIDEKGVPIKDIPSPKDAIWHVTEQDGSRCILKYIEKPPKEASQRTSENETNEEPPEKDEESTDSTTTSGDVIIEKVTIPLDPLPIYTATDPETKEVMITRQDKATVLKRPNGSMIAEHFDGTRITSQGGSSSSVIVENPVFARVTYESMDHCALDLPNDFHIKCKPLGEYDIIEGNRTVLAVSSNGSVTYKHARSSTSTYKLSHSNNPKHVLKAKDGVGRKYTVGLSDGISVSGGDAQTTDVPQYFLPRVFVLADDRNGFQLCNKKDVEDFTSSVDVSTMITRDKLPQCPDINTLTVISTDVTEADERTLPFMEGQNIIPKNLKCSTYTTNGSGKGVAGSKRKRFGVGVGKGLSIGSYVPPAPKKTFQKPKSLKYRQFIDFSECGLRESLLDHLTRYIKWRENTEMCEDSLLPDPRTDEIQQNEALKKSIKTFKGMASMDELLNLYKMTWEKVNVSHKPLHESPKAQNTVQVESVNSSTEEEVSPQETAKDGDESVPDMTELASKLPPIKHKSSVSFHLPDDSKPPLNSTPVDEAGSPDSSSQCSPITNNTSLTLGLSELEISTTDTESSPGTFKNARTGSLLNASQSDQDPGGSSPMPRPHNPTPSQGRSNMVITSTPTQSNEEIFKRSGVDSVQGLQSEEYHVKLPRMIIGTKPGNIVNEKFLAVEEPVRRKVYTSSTTQGATTRGFEIFPGAVKFGNLREGCTYAYTCTLKNIGIDTCQFKVKPPPPSTGIRVIYSPGLVAAGMSRELKIEIFAMAVGASSSNEVGGVSYELEIISEANILYLPIQASIFPSLLYNQCFSGGDSLAGASRGTQLVTERPSSREDLNRPSKR